VKILWVTHDKQGGSRLTDDELIKYGHDELGHEIIVDNKVTPGFDLVVLSNLHGLEEPVSKNIYSPYITIAHDYGFCSYYDAMCELHNCIECEWKKKFQQLKKAALLNFFMSPAQYKIHVRMLDEIPNVRFIQSQLDWENLRRLRYTTKKKGTIIAPMVGGYHKGVDNLITWSKRNKRIVTVIGATDSQTEKLKNEKYIDYKGYVNYETALKMIAQSESVLFLPEWTEPTGRAVMEGILLGCKIITNDHLGLYSWITDTRPEDLIMQIQVSKISFWNQISFLLNGWR